MFAVYNFFRQGWIIDRIDRMAEKSFSASPLVISLPYANYIVPDEAQTGRVTFVLSGREAGLSPIRARFARDQFFWVNDRPVRNNSVNAFGQQPPTMPDSRLGDWKLIAPARLESSGDACCHRTTGRFCISRSGSCRRSTCAA